MRANDVQDYLKSLNGGWVDYNNSVDCFKIGDPTVELTGIAVGWMSYTAALQEASEKKCNLFITHEPTWYEHYDRDEIVLNWPESRQKRAIIDELGMTILRCHDLWDQLPQIGIPDAWGQKLGLGKPIDGTGYFRVYDGGGRTVHEIAHELVQCVCDLGQEKIQLIGSADKQVRRIVLGTRAITPYHKMLTTYDADLVICSDDGFCYWRDGAFIIDHDYAALIFNHHVTEDYGLELLADHLRKQFPDVPVHFIRQTCMYRLIGLQP